MAITVPVVDTEIGVAAFGKPVADWINAQTATAWTNVTPLNGYAQFTNQPAQYRKIGDNVQLRGRLAVGTAVFGVAAFQMPVGFRPPGGLVVMTPVVNPSGSWVSAPVDFRAGGDYCPFGVTGATDVSIPLLYCVT